MTSNFDAHVLASALSTPPESSIELVQMPCRSPKSGNASANAVRIDNSKPDDNKSTARPSREPETVATEDESQYQTGLPFWLTLASVAVVLIISSMDASIVAVCVPQMTDNFHTVADVGWYAAAYRLCTCSFQFLFGKLYQVFRLKVVFTASVAVFVVGSVLCAAAPTSASFVVGRAVAGTAAAGIFAGCFVLLVQNLPLRKRPLYTGIFGAIEGLASISSPMLGGAIVDRLGWRWCFWISVPSGALAVLLLLVCLPNTSAPGPDGSLPLRQKLAHLDWLSNLIFLPALTCLFLALSWGGSRYPWASATVIGLFCTFGALVAAFAWVQHARGDAAMLPLRVLRNRSVLAGLVFALCCNSALNVVEYYLPTYFQTVRQYGAAQSGLLTLPAVAGCVLGILAAGAGVSLLGYYVPFMLAASLLMPVFAGLMTTVAVDSSLARILCYSGVYGFAVGIGFQAPQSAVQASLPDRDVSVGLGVILFAQQFGPALFLLAAQSIFTSRLSTNLHDLAPRWNATTIEAMGLTDLKNQIGADDLGAVLTGIDTSLAQTWYLAVGLTCLTMVGSVAMEWRSVKDKKE
jgi:MFS family permease